MSNDSVSATGPDRGVNNFGRHSYRKLSEDEATQVKDIKDLTQEFADQIMKTRPSHERDVALDRLAEASMWAIRGITE
jgi:ClpP class serine protease